MNKAIVTNQGSDRIGVASGTVVEFDRCFVVDGRSFVNGYFINGERLGGRMNISLEQNDLPKDDNDLAAFWFAEQPALVDKNEKGKPLFSHPWVSDSRYATQEAAESAVRKAGFGIAVHVDRNATKNWHIVVADSDHWDWEREDLKKGIY